MGITISKELIKVIPFKMMYYLDFLCPHPLPRPPPFQDFHNSALKGKKWWQTPPDCLKVMLHETVCNDDF